ncbi:response regulator transcription factor [Thermoflavimicrobium daqui]|uniref:DNA-binding response regulator n=1 Tax=Thermoflavimicrobium daqui TaxID=2137476 RepID=A0A364K458_9BACL|nr:response regulator transcription factor [Thermoflavimicrobium daqui]RAL24153.1 DNA-binding response regulator [Thermoflavimicrobium daqui]
MCYKILVIEDDLDIQELIQEFLTTQNMSVDVASDGIEGIQLFQRSSYDLVILDVMLPNMDGYHVCQIIRNKSSVPIIMLTALGEEKDQIKGFDLGVDDYITKPFSFHILIKRVEAVLRRTCSSPAHILKFKEIHIDIEAYTVHVNEEKIDLTAKEFEILSTLIENQGKVVTREILLDKVWGFDFYGDSRVVDTHIKNLRKKLKVPYIKTVKGMGYKLDT